MTVTCEKVGLEFFDEAPVKYVSVEEVKGTPERIFEVFLDADAWSTWAFAITDVEWTSPMPPEIGTTRNVTMLGNMIGYEEFIAWEDGKRMAFRFNECNKPMAEAFAENWLVTDLGNGSCRVEWTMAMQPSGPGTKLTPVTKFIMAPVLRHMLKKFRLFVESNPVLASDAAGEQA
jgi:hypothetical protein